MAKPWEKYQSSEERAPWKRYQRKEQASPEREAPSGRRAQPERPDDLLSRTGRDIRSFAEGATGAAGDAYRWITGDVKREDLPELSEATLPALARLSGVSPGGPPASKEEIDRGAKMAMGYLASSDPQQVADIAVNTLPGAKTRTDDEGNLIVQYDGKEYYVNRPGASTSDVMQITGEIMSYLPAARFASFGKGLINRGIRAFTGEAATSAARDVASGALGSEQGVDLGRAMMAGTFGAGGEAIAPLAARILPKILRNPKYVTKQGELTKSGRRAARTAGFDPDDMDRALRQEFGRVARDAPEGTLETYGRVAQSNRYGIPLTQGEATRNPTMLATERDILHQSDEAGDVMRGFKQRQREAVERAGGEVQAELGGLPRGASPTVESMGDVARSAQGGMASRAQRLDRQIDEAYDTARASEAQVSPRGMQGLEERVSVALEDYDVVPDNTPAAARARQLIYEAADEAEEGGLSIRRLEQLRKRINNRISGASSREDRAATQRIKAALDDHIDDAFDRALFSGDPEALSNLKKARSLRRQYTQQFGDTASKDRIDKIIGKISSETAEPKDIVNWTFGWSQLGNKSDSRKIVSRIKNALGTDSPEWGQMQEGGFFRLIKDGSANARTPTQMKSALKRTMEQNKEMLDELYTDEQQKTIRKFIDSAALTQALPKELGNPSQTAFTVRDMLRRGGSYAQASARIHGNFTGGLLFSTLRRMIKPGQAAKAANRLTEPVGPARPRAPIVGAGGAAYGAQNEEEARGLLDEAYRLGRRGIRAPFNLLTE